MTGTLLTVLVYDVVDDRRRGQLHALLKQYGVAVQKSAFEARLTPREREQLLRRVSALVDESTDRFVMYTLADEQEEKIAALGAPRPRIAVPRFYVI